MTEALPEGLSIDLSVEAGDWGEEGQLRSIAERAVAAAFSVGDLDVADNSEVSLLFTDDAAIRKLNAQWRDKDKPTNVLSFPGSDPDGESAHQSFDVVHRGDETFSFLRLQWG